MIIVIDMQRFLMSLFMLRHMQKKEALHQVQNLDQSPIQNQMIQKKKETIRLRCSKKNFWHCKRK